MSGRELNEKLPPPPPRPPGVVPRTLADMTEERRAEPPEKKLRPTVIQKYPQMKRPGLGQKGKAVELLCNHFSVTFNPKEPVSQYNVTIEPEVKSGLNRKVMAALHTTYGGEFLKGKRFAYDGEKSLFVVGSLTLRQSEFPVLLPDDPGRGIRRAGNGREHPNSPDPAGRSQPGRDFIVRFAHVATIDMHAINSVLRGERNDKAQEGLRVLDIMLREHAAKRDYLLLKENYFHPTLGPVENIGDGVVLWRGFHVSFRPTSGGLSLNFDISTTLLIQPVQVLQFLSDHCKKPITNFNKDDWLKCRKLLKGVMVETYSGRKHKIIGFSPNSCAKQTFPKRSRSADGSPSGAVEVTVADYFKKERNLTLKCPELPALDTGRPNKPVYFPMELCKILPGQRYKKALNTFQRQHQIDHTRQPPLERQRLIQQAMEKNNYKDDELLKEFNVTIEETMKKVQGRVLDTPKLMFGNRYEEVPRNGRWNFGGRTMKAPVQIPNWAVVCFKGRFPLDARRIATEMKNVCSQKGMKLGDFLLFEEDMSMRNASPVDRVKRVVDQVGKQLGKFIKLDGHEKPFILAILPEKSPELYIPFKRFCEVEIGIVTQCIVPPKGQVNPKYLTSVSLKINLKRGGYNSVLSHEDLKLLPKVSSVPTIIFGLDVSHGSPGDASSPSVAAAVATVDWPNVSRFTTSIRAQEAKVEMIKGLYEDKTSGMVRELLMHFYNFEKRGIKPQQILIFRDGVSESQFDQVLENELVAFKQACASLSEDYCPKITLVVVQKRHHTRFFRTDGSKENIAPGTIVDRDPCHPGSYDFYLCSHAGIIGTSRPTHYHVLYDEIKFTPDELQHLTHSLCYSYTRCTSAVSVVAPAYYAHLAAQHCRNFVQDNYDSGSDSSMMSARIAKAVASLPRLKDYVMGKMFYA
ncbi:unnamed protein product [Calypogeia fissa]